MELMKTDARYCMDLKQAVVGALPGVCSAIIFYRFFFLKKAISAVIFFQAILFLPSVLSFNDQRDIVTRQKPSKYTVRDEHFHIVSTDMASRILLSSTFPFSYC